jgi:lysozyme
MNKEVYFIYNQKEAKHEAVNVSPVFFAYSFIGFCIGLSFAAIILHFILSNKNLINNNRVVVVESQKVKYSDIDKIRLKNIVIEKIKIEEGFSAKPYKCMAGYKTIGYGHLIKDSEKPKLKSVSLEQADSILLSDFNYALSFISKKHPNIMYNEQLALAHFVFNFGEVKYNKSELPKLVEIGDTNKIKSKLLEYNKVSVNGKLVFNNNLLNMRIFEGKLFDFRFINIL